MRAIVLGDYEFERIRGPLLRSCERLMVVANRPPHEDHLAKSIEWTVADLSELDVKRLVRRSRPDVVVPHVRGSENEAVILDFAVSLQNFDCGRNSVHSPAFAGVCVDKKWLYEFAVRNGITVPETRVCYSRRELHKAVAAVGGMPVVVKERRANSGTGTFLVSDSLGFDVVPDEGFRSGILVQRLLRGIEIGVEVVSSPRGHWRFPTCHLGMVGGDVNPLGRVRFAPFNLSASADRQLTAIIDRICRMLRPNGPWQLDAVMTEGSVHVLEINGRLGGLSNLSMFSSGTDPHRLYCETALGQLPEQPDERGFVTEFPVPIGFDWDERTHSGVRLKVQPSRSRPSWRMLAAGLSRDAVLSAVHSIPANSLRQPELARIESSLEKAQQT